MPGRGVAIAIGVLVLVGGWVTYGFTTYAERVEEARSLLAKHKFDAAVIAASRAGAMWWPQSSHQPILDDALDTGATWIAYQEIRAVEASWTRAPDMAGVLERWQAGLADHVDADVLAEHAAQAREEYRAEAARRFQAADPDDERPARAKWAATLADASGATPNEAVAAALPGLVAEASARLQASDGRDAFRIANALSWLAARYPAAIDAAATDAMLADCVTRFGVRVPEEYRAAFEEAGMILAPNDREDTHIFETSSEVVDGEEVGYSESTGFGSEESSGLVPGQPDAVLHVAVATVKGTIRDAAGAIVWETSVSASAAPPEDLFIGGTLTLSGEQTRLRDEARDKAREAFDERLPRRLDPGAIGKAPPPGDGG